MFPETASAVLVAHPDSTEIPEKMAKASGTTDTKWRRPDWDEYFLKLAMLASERATCPRLHCGCVLVRARFVLATGYNGSLPGAPHCYTDGCLLVKGHCVRTNHAEINAICQATRHGVILTGASAYVTNMPCTACAKALAAAGIERVVIFSEYHDTLAERFFAESAVELMRRPVPSRRICYDVDQFPSARKTHPPTPRKAIETDSDCPAAPREV